MYFIIENLAQRNKIEFKIKMLNMKQIIVAFFCMFSFVLLGQEKEYQISCVAFYNLENLFDTINDPTINDEQFLPDGSYGWTGMKYNNKLEKMAYAISQIGTKYTSNGPVILGVSEIENRGVLEDLVKMPKLKDRNYGIVHYDSPDRRGIDVGLLYNPEHFEVVNSVSYLLSMENDTAFRTRDQLMVEGLLDGERIYVIVNHWPSRSGGEARSRPKRVAAAALTKHISDSILATNQEAKIIIMGDLNDDPTNESCKKTLGAKKSESKVGKGDLFNATWPLFSKGIGSLAYRDNWNLFDQIIISSGLLNDEDGYKYWKTFIFNKDFLIQQEGRYKGYPLRTHAGGAYLNGYSDHFPSYIYLIREK